MGSPLPLKNLLVLGAIAAVGFIGAYVVFSGRDISHRRTLPLTTNR
jgi:hypothetical protein